MSIMTSEKIKIDDGFYLINSRVGWMFSGRFAQTAPKGYNEVEVGMLVKDTSMEQLWDLESVGITETTTKDEEQRAMEQFNAEVILNNGRYQVPWLWKHSKYELPSNYNLCETRLKSLYSSKSEVDMQLYDSIIRKQLENGHIEEADCSKEYKDRKDVVLHYVPHHMVRSAEKSRIVYEGCAKSHPSHKSLNECLYRGKNMLADLCGMLIRFRVPKIALLADIEKAYLQLALKDSDRDTTRFLWLKDIKKTPSKDNNWELRFCRVIWGIISASFLLAATITYHLSKLNTSIAQKIARDLYVDNLVSGVSSTGEAIEFYKKTKEIFRSAAMNMCKWVSNSDKVMEKIDTIDKNSKDLEKVLGMVWKVRMDVLCYPNLKEVKIKNFLTKRIMLKIIHGIFDPTGLIAPVLLKPKLLVQKCWKMNVDWDVKVPTVIEEEWDKWVSGMVILSDISIKRCVNLSVGSGNTYELIIFTDASKDAYAAAAYLKVSTLNHVECNLIFSKSRLCPVKEVSIPRLELLGVLIGCRISKFIVKEIGVKVNQLLFTDSVCVIEWYKSKKKLKRFVQDKIDEIRLFEGRIGYVKSNDNPADLASRGSTLGTIIDNNQWWKGPVWMSDRVLPEDTYHIDDETRDQIAKEEVLHEVGLINKESEILNPPFGININSFSSFNKLITITGWCRRFISNCLKKDGVLCGYLHTTEIQESVLLWDRFVQLQSFPTIFDAIMEKKKHALNNLGVIKNEQGILVCKGRFQKSKQLSPKLLPKNTIYTKLVIERSHKRVLHSGVAQTLSELRKDYWIIQGRSAVRKVLRECLTCIRWEGAPFRTPDFAPLPEFVITIGDKVPFAFVGLDYFGPMLVKENTSIVKVWGCLFTCLKVRAVHIEIVDSMSTESFLLALRRFVGRRGKPGMILSDNANQFKQGQEVIDRIWYNMSNDDQVQSYVAHEGIEWKWVTEYSPWKGGCYERLIEIAKRACKKALGKCVVNKEQIITLIIEVEAVMNSRPLVYIGDDVNSREALTPAHFLSTNCKHGFPDIDVGYNPVEISSDGLLETWKKGQVYLNNFWNIWLKEYLQTLRETHTTKLKPIKGQVNRIPRIGEAVILKEELVPRGRWKLGRIDSLIESGVDGVYRAAIIVTSSGKKLKRPYRLLYPLEGSNEVDYSPLEVSNSNETRSNVPQGSDTKKNTRQAAQAAQQRIKKTLQGSDSSEED